MAEAKTAVAHKPVWVDLSSTDPAGARDYYSKLFGWKIEVNPDPKYGGYAMAQSGGKDVAGIGPTQAPGSPSAWMIYIGTKDSEQTAKKVTEAGGKVIVPGMDVPEQGIMAVYQDPSGAFISTWQPHSMGGAQLIGAPNSMAWAELNARGIDKAKTFYKKVFGWGDKNMPMGEGMGDYTEFQLGGESIAGGMEMNPMVPAEMPSYWMVYFGAEDVDKAHQKALDAGGREMMPPGDFPGGRFSILSDPQGAAFGLLQMRS
jgi:predicted enzyme related to lactoylglutathione lyase